MMLERVPPSRLTETEVLDRVLDKGIVIDAQRHFSIVGTELVTVSSHVVVASIETYLKYFAEGGGIENPRPSKPRARTLRDAPRLIDFPEFLPD
jgi:hypothetical protein